MFATFALVLMLVGAEFSGPTTLKLQVPDGTSLHLSRAIASKNRILIFEENGADVLLFDQTGRFLAKLSLEKSGESVTMAADATWFADEAQFYVYDIARLAFSIWDQDGNHIKTVKTDFDMFFYVGHLTKTASGYIGPITMAENHMLLSQFGPDFKIKKFGYKIFDEQLADMSPEVRRSFCAGFGTGGDRFVVGMQSLSPVLKVFDQNLELVREVALNPPGWNEVDLRKLGKVSRNPKLLTQYSAKYSEVVGLASLGNTHIVVGFRNIDNFVRFTYQAYALADFSTVGGALKLSERLLTTFENKAYFARPHTTEYTLTVYSFH